MRLFGSRWQSNRNHRVGGTIGRMAARRSGREVPVESNTAFFAGCRQVGITGGEKDFAFGGRVI
jgi:hypothetical protein